MELLFYGLPLVACYVVFARWCSARFVEGMLGRPWLPRHTLIYATLLAFLYTPGCLTLRLPHGNALPLPMPASLALCGGSLWGGLIPLMFGWVYAYTRVHSRVLARSREQESDADP